jgi:hypothetical protein
LDLQILNGYSMMIFCRFFEKDLKILYRDLEIF